MDIKKMIEVTEITEFDTELLVSKVNISIINLYKEKDIRVYIETLKDLLELAVHLKFDIVLKYFGAVPVVAKDERIQFQEIFKCLGTRKSNKDWFLNLFSLFLGVALVFGFDRSEIERNFYEKNSI
ncbi:dimeric dUTPase (all-alpha-NTP-PPase superfamily) [Bacillus pakistanensis]|uniref:Dimeric dUTPase (All-alpha-NTP-PPase superfamily) n=1 Tax=Rossellomorea pakistanensis TaxID=992288 RepID=A0ABS2N854_9BACI|nr:hypothetical protein [Bacillus pakistanensis]MBM7583965.1 dimeric dUTPase (all-alpha-NTP-PPase superfamily) [Bacillus pakistanensis]